MSGEEETPSTEFVGDAMLAVTRAAIRVGEELGELPVVVGGLAVLCRLTHPYRATVDLDVVERQQPGVVSQLELLRRMDGADPAEPSAVIIQTESGEVRVDVLIVNPADIENPSDDPGDRLSATSHAWALDTATEHVVVAVSGDRSDSASARIKVARPGPIIAMKLQAIPNRTKDKEGTDLLDIVRLVLDPEVRDTAIAHLAGCPEGMRADMALHVNLYFAEREWWAMERLSSAGGSDLTTDDFRLVRDLLVAALVDPADDHSSE